MNILLSYTKFSHLKKNLKYEKNKIYMVLKYAGRAGNEYPLQIYEDIYGKIKTPKIINIPMVNIKYFQHELRHCIQQERLSLPLAARHISIQLRLLIRNKSFFGGC